MMIEIAYYIALIAGLFILPTIFRRYGMLAHVALVVHTIGNSMLMPLLFGLPLFNLDCEDCCRARHQEA
jgi:hypothetical protein